MDKIFEDRLFEAKRSWDEGNHSEDNLWANWKFEQAEKVEKTYIGSFEWWDSLYKNPSKIERMVQWAELVLSGPRRYDVMDKIFEDQLFETKRSWDKGNHSEDNLWANWKFGLAEKEKNPHCGTFKRWDSSNPAPSKIERMVKWAELVLQSTGLNTGSRYTIVKSHLRRLR